MKSINPATNQIIKEYSKTTDKEVDKAIENAHQTYLEWRRLSLRKRIQPLLKLSEILKQNTDDYAKIMTLEMGKVFREAQAEVQKCALLCDYYAQNAESFLADQISEQANQKNIISFQSLGIILAIMPWNFPFWQVFRCAVPFMMAGNVGLLRHAHNVSGCALSISKAFQKAGFPKYGLQTLLVEHHKIPAIIQHDYVQGVTLTGSTYAGSQVAKVSGESIKKTVLELGGCDPYLILEDADLDLAAEVCAKSRLINAGQSCIAAKRFIVIDKVYDDFVEKFKVHLSQAKMGDPMSDQTRIGPLARMDLRDNLHKQVQGSIKKGAHCLLGGTLPEGPGAFLPPYFACRC